MKIIPCMSTSLLLFMLGIADAGAQNEPKGIQSASAVPIQDAEKVGYIGLDPLPVTEVKFYSESLQRDMYMNVVLPRGYQASKLRYPVLYLCHGYTSNYHEFEYVGVPKYLNMFDMMVVMVDVGNSFYLNYAKSEEGQHNNYADHVCIDVINYIDKNYRTIAERKGRAINGISMGGFGAISLGLSHPDLFCSIGSHSGALNMAAAFRQLLEKGGNLSLSRAMESDTLMRYRGIDIPGFSTMKERTPKGQPFLTVEDIDKVDPFKLVLKVPKEKLPHIYIDCGDKDRLDVQSLEFIKLLTENNIPFQHGRSEGVHEEDYWGREVCVSMAVQYVVMLRNIWGRKFEVYDAWPKK